VRILKVLVTGGAGYIGSHTARQLAAEGYEVVIYDNLSRGHREAVSGFNFVRGDVRDKDRLRRVIKEEGISAVLHFAANSQVGESVENPELYYENNVAGGLSLLSVVLETGIKYFIFSSSAAVYGEPQYVPIDEEHTLNPTNPYGETKVILERALAAYDKAYNLKSVSLRYFNACGAHMGEDIGEDHEPETHLIPLVLKTALGQREQLIVFGKDYPTKDGTAVRDYIHVDDLARAHVISLKYLLDGGETTCFNLGNGNGFSVLDVIKAAEKVTGRKVPYKFGNRRPGDPAILVASAEKIKRELGWEPEITSLERIIQSAWEWHRKHPTGFAKR